MLFGRENGEEHQIPAIYDIVKDKKYYLSSLPASGVKKAEVVFRPDRQIWRYEYEDIKIDITLILPRLISGYLLKVEIKPISSAKGCSERSRWIICHELRGFHGKSLKVVEAEYDTYRGMVWFKSNKEKNGEAIGSTLDAHSIDIGRDGLYASDIMVMTPFKCGLHEKQTACYFARAFGDTALEAKGSVEKLLSSPEKLEIETMDWWNSYLNGIPYIDTPDEAFSKNILWSWADFRMSRIDVDDGIVPSGMFYCNNGFISVEKALFTIDQMEAEAVQLLNDADPARKLILLLLINTHQTGMLSGGFISGREYKKTYACSLAYTCGLLHKYILNTGEIALLSEDIGGVTVLRRLEDALEAQLSYRDDDTGLFRTDNETFSKAEDTDIDVSEKIVMRPNMESVTRYRGGPEVFKNDCNATIYGSFVAMSEIEDIIGDNQKSARYAQIAKDLKESIQKYLWDDKIQFFTDKMKDDNMGLNVYRGIGGFVTGLFSNHVLRPGGLADDQQSKKLAKWCGHEDFTNEFGVFSLARNHPYFDHEDYKGFSGGFDMHWCNQVPAGLYAHGCNEEAHKQLFKLFERLNWNGGLGPRYRGEAYNSFTGEIIKWRFQNYPMVLSALSSIYEGVFGLRWKKAGLIVEVNSPWPWVKLFNLKIRKSVLDLEFSKDGMLSAVIDGDKAIKAEGNKLELYWNMFKD